MIREQFLVTKLFGKAWQHLQMSNGHMLIVLYEAQCMVSSCSFFQWMLLGDLRVRCRNMSDVSFMSGIRSAVSTSVLQVCYHSQTFLFIPRNKQEYVYDDWPALLITVHNLSLETQSSFIQRCLARSNLKPLVRSIKMGKQRHGRENIIRQYCDVFLTNGRLFKRLRRAFRRWLEKDELLYFTSTPIL